MDAMDDAHMASFLAENRQDEVYATHGVFFAISIFSLATRFWTLRFSERKLGWDDWFALIAGVGDVGVFTISMLWLRFGLGRHALWAIEQDPKNITYFFQAVMANEILYTTTLASARLSIVFFYYRIFGITKMRLYLHGLVCFIGAWAISTYGPAIWACAPIEDFWGEQRDCINLYSYYVGVAIGSIITDAVLIVLPLPFVWSLQMTVEKKILISLSFLFGSFNCFVTIIRLHIVVGLDLSDPTYNTTDLMVWTGLELYCAVICCCLPTFPVLIQMGLKKIGLQAWMSHATSKAKSHRLGGEGNSAPASGPGRGYPKRPHFTSTSVDNIVVPGDDTQSSELRPWKHEAHSHV